MSFELIVFFVVFILVGVIKAAREAGGSKGPRKDRGDQSASAMAEVRARLMAQQRELAARGKKLTLDDVKAEIDRVRRAAQARVELGASRVEPPAQLTARVRPVPSIRSRISVTADDQEAEPEVVDEDEISERVAAQRIAEVEASEREITDEDYKAFEEKIRRQPADATAVQPTSPRFAANQLRQAFVWSEILGRPKGMEM